MIVTGGHGSWKRWGEADRNFSHRTRKRQHVYGQDKGGYIVWSRGGTICQKCVSTEIKRSTVNEQPCAATVRVKGSRAVILILCRYPFFQEFDGSQITPVIKSIVTSANFTVLAGSVGLRGLSKIQNLHAGQISKGPPAKTALVSNDPVSYMENCTKYGIKVAFRPSHCPLCKLLTWFDYPETWWGVATWTWSSRCESVLWVHFPSREETPENYVLQNPVHDSPTRLRHGVITHW